MPHPQGGAFTPHISALEFEKLSYVTLSFRSCTQAARRLRFVFRIVETSLIERSASHSAYASVPPSTRISSPLM